jgi:hypothetical protein
MTVHERVMARLDEIEATTRLRRAPLDGQALQVAWTNGPWTRQVWLPSLRSRAERHRPMDLGRVEHCCHGCRPGACAPWPCPDFLDLCAELGINPEETT